MKIATAHALAAASLLALAACGGLSTSLQPQSQAVVASSGTYYCWSERLADNGQNLTCNWAHSMADACDSTTFTSLAKSSVSGMQQRTHRCENGQWLVAVTSH
jgi:hypothetical protein